MMKEMEVTVQATTIFYPNNIINDYKYDVLESGLYTEEDNYTIEEYTRDYIQERLEYSGFNISETEIKKVIDIVKNLLTNKK